MKTIYLNANQYGITETVDEFTQEPKQSYRDFKKYVNEMVKEYYMAGMDVYKSQRCTNDWRDK